MSIPKELKEAKFFSLYVTDREAQQITTVITRGKRVETFTYEDGELVMFTSHDPKQKGYNG
jgi:hypothetical protein